MVTSPVLRSRGKGPFRGFIVTLHQLRVFEAVARLLNVTAAAKLLSISQPTVSSQVRLLEEEYCCKFFTRSNQGMALTERGQAFVAAIQPILHQLAAVKTEFSGRDEPAANSLSLGANSTLTDTLLPDVLTDFKEAYPGVDIVVRTADSHTLEKGVLDSGIEVALITKPSFSPDYIYEVLENYEAVAFVPSESPIRDETMMLEDLARYPLIAMRGTSCAKEITARGYKLKLECDAPETVISAVKRRWGVGFMFRERLTNEIVKGSVRIIRLPELSDMKHRSYIAYDRRRLLSPIARNFIAVLRRRNEMPPAALSPTQIRPRPIAFKKSKVSGSKGKLRRDGRGGPQRRRPPARADNAADH
jgi:DNA-binding transcriptional LysR family regulator